MWYQVDINARIKWNGATGKWSDEWKEIRQVPNGKCACSNSTAGLR